MWRSQKVKSWEMDFTNIETVLFVHSCPKCDSSNQLVQDGACCSLWVHFCGLMEEQLV
jgi:hypothetical protein